MAFLKGYAPGGCDFSTFPSFFLILYHSRFSVSCSLQLLIMGKTKDWSLLFFIRDSTFRMAPNKAVTVLVTPRAKRRTRGFA